MSNYSTSNPMGSNVSITWDVSSQADEMHNPCTTCRFFEPNLYADHGTCHRFPQAVTVANLYWCGEYRRSSAMETK